MLAITVAIIGLACGFLYVLDRMHQNEQYDLFGFVKFSVLGSLVSGGALWAYGGQGSAAVASAAVAASAAVEDVFTGLPQF